MTADQKRAKIQKNREQFSNSKDVRFTFNEKGTNNTLAKKGTNPDDRLIKPVANYGVNPSSGIPNPDDRPIGGRAPAFNASQDEGSGGMMAFDFSAPKSKPSVKKQTFLKKNNGIKKNQQKNSTKKQSEDEIEENN